MFKGDHVFAYSNKIFSFSTQRSFSLWSARYLEEIRLERSDFGGRHFETWQPGRVYVMSFRPTRNWREREKPKTDLESFTRSAKFSFFQAIIRFTIFNATISDFGECLARQNNMTRAAITQSGSLKAFRKLFGQNLSNRMMSRKRGLAAEYCSKGRQRCSNFGLLWRRIS